MRAIPLKEAYTQSMEALGLDPEVSALDSPEALAVGLRRAAGFLCPASRRTLIQAVMESLKGLLVTPGKELRERLSDVIEDLIGHGDLLELDDISNVDAQGSQVYRAPPSFVRRESGAALILGVAPDDVSPLTVDLQKRITHNEHARVIPPAGEAGRDVRHELLDLGLIEIPLSAWTKAPAPIPAADHLKSMQGAVAKQSRCGEVAGLTLLEPESPVRYYRGRWTDPQPHHSGFFVGRRPQAFGADLWCFAELNEGRPIRLLDLRRNRVGRGCDRAWHIQAAIDHQRGSPQVCEFQEMSNGNALLSFFHPVPQWARRRWSALGRPVRRRSALFGYEIALHEWAEEKQYMKNHLWLSVVP